MSIIGLGVISVFSGFEVGSNGLDSNIKPRRKAYKYMKQRRKSSAIKLVEHSMILLDWSDQFNIKLKAIFILSSLFLRHILKDNKM
jgi:hypothetical protein